jgi:hypothetical protein
MQRVRVMNPGNVPAALLGDFSVNLSHSGVYIAKDSFVIESLPAGALVAV